MGEGRAGAVKILEKKEVTHVEVKEVIVGRTCDVCGAEIKPVAAKDRRMLNPAMLSTYDYFMVRTWHDDWGYDSVDSIEYFDACCPECAMKFVKEYIEEAYKTGDNSMQIKVQHANSLFSELLII